MEIFISVLTRCVNNVLCFFPVLCFMPVDYLLLYIFKWLLCSFSSSHCLFWDLISKTLWKWIWSLCFKIRFSNKIHFYLILPNIQVQHDVLERDFFIGCCTRTISFNTKWWKKRSRHSGLHRYGFLSSSTLPAVWPSSLPIFRKTRCERWCLSTISRGL